MPDNSPSTDTADFCALFFDLLNFDLSKKAIPVDPPSPTPFLSVVVVRDITSFTSFELALPRLVSSARLVNTLKYRSNFTARAARSILIIVDSLERTVHALSRISVGFATDLN